MVTTLAYSESLIFAFKKQNTDIKVFHLMCSYHEIQPNGKEHELSEVFFSMIIFACSFLYWSTRITI